MREVEREDLPANHGLAKLGILIAAAAGIMVLLHLVRSAGVAEWADPGALAELMEKASLGGAGGFLLFSSVLIFAGVPRLLFFALGGMLLGIGWGFGLALAASLAGSYASFRLLRWGGRGALVKWTATGGLPEKFTRSTPTVMSVFMIRQLPVSNLLINAGLAMGRVGTPTFLAGSLLGFIPQGAVAALVGSGAAGQTLAQGAAPIGMAAAIVAVAWCVWSAWSRKQRQPMGEA